jgi:phage N-6-adenine-methyltransferase
VATLFGVRAQNHPQQAVTDRVDDRRTPMDFFTPLHEKHRFTVDAAASEDNALLPVHWTRETNALAQPWAAHRVWCNPPYSGLEPWLAKAWEEMASDCELVVMLLPANRTEQPFWQRHVEPYRDGRSTWSGIRLSVSFLPNRMRFGYPAGRIRPKRGDRPPFGCVLLTWDRE